MAAQAPRTLEEVIVTGLNFNYQTVESANKMPLSTKDTPQSLKLITEDVIDFASIKSFEDAYKVDASGVAAHAQGRLHPKFLSRLPCLVRQRHQYLGHQGRRLSHDRRHQSGPGAVRALRDHQGLDLDHVWPVADRRHVERDLEEAASRAGRFRERGGR